MKALIRGVKLAMYARKSFKDKESGEEVVYFEYTFRDDVGSVLVLNAKTDSLAQYEGKDGDLEVTVEQSTFGGRVSTKIRPEVFFVA